MGKEDCRWSIQVRTQNEKVSCLPTLHPLDFRALSDISVYSLELGKPISNPLPRPVPVGEGTRSFCSLSFVQRRRLQAEMTQKYLKPIWPAPRGSLARIPARAQTKDQGAKWVISLERGALLSPNYKRVPALGLRSLGVDKACTG